MSIRKNGKVIKIKNLNWYNYIKRHVLVSLFIIFIFTTNISYSQQENKSELSKTEFTRGSGFVIRPELYSGVNATLGYQINPYVQISGGFGFGIDGGFLTSFGVRAYTSDKNWAGMFDYHIGLVNFSGYNLIRHTIVGGASYKDFDFGAGLLYISDGYSSGIGLSITLGYNIRCYKHR